MLRQENEKPPLASIIPPVFYHGARRWNASEDFTDLIAGSDALNHYTPLRRRAQHDRRVAETLRK